MKRARWWPILAVLALSVAGASAKPTVAAFPGRDGRIAFASNRHGNLEIYVVQPDGTDLRRLTRNPARDEDPAWSPDGTRIAFVSDRGGNVDIYLATIDRSGVTRLTTNPDLDYTPEWSPDGTRIIFSSVRDGEGDIYVMNADGTGQTRLVSLPRNDFGPAWSPDGSTIAFMSQQTGPTGIYVMSSDGSNVRPLATSGLSNDDPSWSPDGKRIAFTSYTDGGQDVYVMNADGSQRTQLTKNLAHDSQPAWSPAGDRIAFTSMRDIDREIYIMRADGTGQTRLTVSPHDDVTPNWETIPIPPPVVSSASFRVRWRESASLGNLAVAGTVPTAVEADVVLRRAGHIRLANTLRIAEGPFRRALPLPRTLVPGLYDVDVIPDTPAFSRQTLPIRLLAPPEGVVSRTWASTNPGGLPLSRFSPRTSVVFAHFRLAALPARGRRISVSWYRPGGAPAGPPSGKPASRVVVAFVGSRTGGPLPRGLWRAVLRAGTTVVKRLTFRVG